jgi:hypothetical protein
VVSDLIAAAQAGDTSTVVRLTAKNFPQEDLAVVATYALEGCAWQPADATADAVRGTFTCPSEGPLPSREFVFTLRGSRITDVHKAE